MNTRGRYLRDPINSRLARWQLLDDMDECLREKREEGMEPVSMHQIQLGVGRMNGLTRNWTAESVSRGQAFWRKQGQRKFNFLVQLTTSRIGDHTG